MFKSRNFIFCKEKPKRAVNGMSPFKVICLTGGPCAGKSSSVSILSELFESLGYKVYRVPETATLLFSGGVHFPELSDDQAYAFQKSILSVMIQIENTYRELAALNAGRGIKTVLICDRGCMDPSAYMKREEWLRMLNELGLDEVALRDHRYDAVFHLVTAAKGAEAFYQVENNATRTEGLDLARYLDDLVMKSWLGHSQVSIISNLDVKNFTEKLDQLVQAVSNRLGLITDASRLGKRVKKRKFLVSGYQHCQDASTFPLPCRDFLVEHCYLVNSTQDGTQTRIRKRQEMDHLASSVVHFTMTNRRYVDGQRVEIRRNISPREYLDLKSQLDPMRVPVRKVRRCFLWQERFFHLDVFQSPRENLVLLEGYLPDDDTAATTTDLSLQGIVPDFLSCVDVTDNIKYSMFNLCRLEEETK